MDLTRRELCLAFPVALLPALLAAESAQQPTALASSMYPFDKLPLQTTNDAQFRAVLKGKLATGESLEVHETTLAAGGAPHPPHHHVHSEMWLVKEARKNRMPLGQQGAYYEGFHIRLQNGVNFNFARMDQNGRALSSGDVLMDLVR